jgi:hypothetical protein
VERRDVILKRFYPGLLCFSAVCFAVSAACLIGLLFLENLHGAIILAALTAVMAALGGALWVAKTVLEAAFHLEEQIRETKQR